MRYMGIDYGDKRIGIAISDPGGRISFPEKTVRNHGNPYIWDEILSIIQEKSVSRIIVGLPLSFEMQETDESIKVRKFVEELKKITPLPIEFENEAATTRMAKKLGVKNEHTDEAAAAIILQSYLDKHDSRGT